MSRYAASSSPLSAVVKLLKAKGADPKRYLMSENASLDGQDVELKTALKETVGCQMGTFISCLPSRLGYFEDEDGHCILNGRGNR